MQDEGGAREASSSSSAFEGIGDTIGRYELTGKLGEGGFGVVYLAEQTRPVKRSVALKVIKPGMDAAAVIARFEAERQALAMMEHPHIARVLDAGSTDGGRPFFVMELVHGTPITTFCDEHTLSLAERLDLFVKTCQAVQHAHQKGIIHRDIKPSNVLVTFEDGIAVPKVIDFGIAKATNARLTENTLFTQVGQFIGTPEYMSPEQAEMGDVDIDTRSDVYSLGVLLYELLTGTTPFDSVMLRGAGLVGIHRIICEEEPPRPSTRLHQLETRSQSASTPPPSDDMATLVATEPTATDYRSTTTIDTIAKERATDPKTLGRSLRGDLDWIIMRALEKERSRRYETANGLAADIRRYLAGEPVVAAPPSTGYRISKFVRRNRGLVAAASVVAATMTIGAIGTTWGMLWALEAEGDAQDRATELSQVVEFQSDMLRGVDSTDAGLALVKDLVARFRSGLGDNGLSTDETESRVAAFQRDIAEVNATDAAATMIHETILAPAVDAIGERFGEQPAVDASLRGTLGTVYHSLGRFEDALPLRQHALDTQTEVLGADDPSTILTRITVAATLERLGRGEEAESHAREALKTAERVLGTDHRDTLLAQSELADALKYIGKFEESEAIYHEVVEGRTRTLGEDHPDTLLSLNDVSTMHLIAGRYEEAEASLRDLLERSTRALGADDRISISALSNLALAVKHQGKWDLAETYRRESLQSHRRLLGSDHPSTALELHNLASLLQSMGRPEDAEPIAREALGIHRKLLGEDHRETLVALNALGITLARQGRHADAEPYWREALERGRRVMGAEHPDTIIWTSNFGGLLRSQNKLEEAEPYHRDALAISERVHGDEHPITIILRGTLGFLLLLQDNLDEAEQHLVESRAKGLDILGAQHPSMLDITVNNARLLLAKGDAIEAEPLFRESLEGYIARFGPNHTRTGNGHLGLGRSLTDQTRYAEAEVTLLEAERVLVDPDAPDGARYDECLVALVTLYDAWNVSEPGAGHDAKADAWRARQAAYSEGR